MKPLVFATIVGIALVIMGAIVVHIDEPIQHSSNQEVIGITVSGKVGVHVADTLCVNPTNGQVEYCF